MFKINPNPEWYEKAVESERDYELCIGPICEIAWHVHLLYLLILKDKLTVEDILNADPIVTKLMDHRSAEITGELGGQGGRLFARVIKDGALELLEVYRIKT